MFLPVKTGLLVQAAFVAHAEGRTREAIDVLTRALRQAQADNDEAAGALIMTNLGTILLDIGEYEPAVTALAAALPVQQELGERGGEQRALLGLCGALSSLYRHTEALDHGRRAVVLGQDLGDVAGVASAHNQLGNAARRAGLTIEALENYQAAAAVYREHGRTAELAEALNNIGGLRYSLGRPLEAAEALEAALPLHRAANDIGGQVSAENIMGWVLRDLGRPEEALIRLKVADQLARDSGDPHLIGATAQRVGGVYLALGRIDEAVEEYREADRVARILAQPWEMGAAANSLARALLVAGDATGAAEQMERAVELATRIAVPAAQATAQVGLGIARLRTGNTDGAAAAVEHAMRISVQLDDRHTQAVAVGVGGQVAAAIGRLEQARELLSEAAARFERLGSDLGVVTALTDLAEVHRSLGHVNDAVTAFERAMTLSESVRARIADDDARASFFTSASEVASRYCAILVSVGRVADALRAAERGRAQVLTERLARLRTTAHRDVDAAAVARRAEIHRELLAVQQQLETLLRTPNADDAEMAATRDRRRSLELRLRTNTAELRSGSPRFAELVVPRVPDLATLRREIIGDSVLLEYVLGQQESFLIAVTADRQQAFPLPPQAEIERMVTELRAAVLSRQRIYPHGDTLFRDLVAPAADLIGSRDVIVVPDGVLHDLPFPLLLTEPVPETAWSYRTLPYLIRDRAVSVLPSVTVAGLITHRAHTGTAFRRELVAFGDPVAPDADRLRYSAREVWDIAGTVSQAVSNAAGRERYDDDSVSVRTGAAATKAELEQLASGPDGLSCRFTHLATHGLLDAARPEFSGLLFSGPPGAAETDTVLRGYEIMDMRIDSELVVLSACETGLGRQLGGEGVLGLSRSFLYAGASALIVSLWRVIDASTFRLMTSLYRHLLDEDPAAALRDAQLAMIDSRLTHPFQWAAFVFVGPSPTARPSTLITA